MALIALMQREFVQKRKLLPAEEFLHGVGLGQILGSFAVNAAFFIGYRLFGAAGGMLSVGVFLMPSLALVIALSHFYFQYHSISALQGAVAGLGPVVIALIVDAAWSLGRQVLRSRAAVCIAGAALAAGALKTNALWVIVAAGVVGLLLPHARRPGPRAPPGPYPGPAAARPQPPPPVHTPARLSWLPYRRRSGLCPCMVRSRRPSSRWVWFSSEAASPWCPCCIIDW